MCYRGHIKDNQATQKGRRRMSCLEPSLGVIGYARAEIG